MSRYKASMSLKKEQIDRLYEGSIDMHIHCAPDPAWDRRMDTLEIAQAAEAGKMSGCVIKSFYYPTTTESRIVDGLMENVNIFGSVTIGYTDYSGHRAHLGRSSAQPDRASAHLPQSAF